MESLLVALSFFFTGTESSRTGRSLSSSSWMETRQRVSSSAATSSKRGAFSALMSFLRSPMVLVDSISTGNALEVASPSTRQNRVRWLSFMA
ncbi:hypothetical protein F5H01DRAFT_359815, partial [Linnemannia elongata]